MSQSATAEASHVGNAGACQTCNKGLHLSFFKLGDKSICPECVNGIRQLVAGKGSRFGRFLTAAALGLGAAVAGAVVYWAVLEFFHINAALITILIGFMVGKAVRRGSGGRGGWRYQALAVFLTYTAITWAYVPALFTGIRQQTVQSSTAGGRVAKSDVAPDDSAARAGKSTPTAPAETRTSAPAPADPASSKPQFAPGIPTSLQLVIGLTVLAALSYAAPVAAGFPDLLNLLIIFFGLAQAWRLNKGINLQISGPHALPAPDSDNRPPDTQSPIPREINASAPVLA